MPSTPQRVAIVGTLRARAALPFAAFGLAYETDLVQPGETR
jgi:hypothetical protein